MVGERLQVDERRRQLLELGIELFAARRHDEISIYEIAEAAGISKGLLYHYFPSRRDFYVATVAYVASELVARLDGVARPSTRGAIEGLRGGMTAYLDFVSERAPAYGMLIRSASGDLAVGEIVEVARRALVGRIIVLLGLDPEDGMITTALLGWIGFVEAASMDWTERAHVGRDELRELLMIVLLTTLGAMGHKPLNGE